MRIADMDVASLPSWRKAVFVNLLKAVLSIIRKDTFSPIKKMFDYRSSKKAPDRKRFKGFKINWRYNTSKSKCPRILL
jgi:hypothetical protein